MQPEIAMALARQHQDELSGDASRHVRPAGHTRPDTLRARRRLPRWHITWTRMTLSPAEEAGGMSGAGRSRPRSSWVIIISPGRPG
jgi:hypothetical protein